MELSTAEPYFVAGLSERTCYAPARTACFRFNSLGFPQRFDFTLAKKKNDRGTAPGILLEDDLLVGVGLEETRLAKEASDLVRLLLANLVFSGGAASCVRGGGRKRGRDSIHKKQSIFPPCQYVGVLDMELPCDSHLIVL